ncbi:MAG: ABC transporter permease [Aquificales bacterium]|nr:ABC transporter permease [Aquificales bacterium]
MRLFWEITRRAYRRYLTYRAAILAGLLTNFFFGVLRVAIILALYGEQQEVAGMTQQQAITYTALTQGVIAYLSIFGWTDLMNSVHNGEVANDLLKPMGLFQFWMARDLGRAIVQFLLRGLTIMVVYAIVFDLIFPTTIWQWTAVFIAVVLSWMISFAYRFLINLSAFWTPNAIGIIRFGLVIAWFFSGFMMPLDFFPDWVIQLARLTPFPSMLDTVMQVFIGALTGWDALAAICIQLAWFVGLFIMGQVVLKAAVKRLVILGG